MTFTGTYWLAMIQAAISIFGLAAFADWIGPPLSFEKLAVSALLFRCIWLENRIELLER